MSGPLREVDYSSSSEAGPSRPQLSMSPNTYSLPSASRESRASKQIHTSPIGGPKYGSPGARSTTSDPFASPRRRMAGLVPDSPTRLPESVGSQERSRERTRINSFSDEYDLAHEDPRILQDLQRALKLKARRDARMKLGQSLSSTRPQMPSSVSRGSGSTALQQFPRPGQDFETSEVDFGPSTEGRHDQGYGERGRMSLHPVPSSADNGSTLDWSLDMQEETHERRWTISMSKRKGKEKEPLVSRSQIEKQEKSYATKITRIRSLASGQTTRKVAITSEQLERRYSLLSSAQDHGIDFDLAKVARWYSVQEPVVQSSLEKAEPLTWLKHLEKRKAGRSIGRAQWHLSALIMEEYLQAQSRAAPPATSARSPKPVLSSQFSFPHSVQSRGSSHQSLPSVYRKKSPDGRISFEPLIESPRHSVEAQSHRSAESVLSSIVSGLSGPSLASPTSSRLQGQIPLLPRDRRFKSESDEASSARHSFPETSEQHVMHTSMTTTLNTETTRIAESTDQPVSEENNSTVTSSQQEFSSIAQNAPSSSKIPPATLPRAFGRRQKQVTLPPNDRLSIIMEQRRQQEEEKVRADQEYELKAQLLEASAAQNTRTRQLLNRISNAVKEYDNLQSGLSNVLGLPYQQLPQTLLDAFSHDPAFVTGATRRLKGYQAVDDIHNRLVRQRNIFESFLRKTASYGVMPLEEDVLKDPISFLIDTLNSLEEVKQEISTKSQEVTDVLNSVQRLHDSTQKEFHDAVTHTSVVYPELSQIAALEESYRDQYQHFWELGMDALTFILDTVTPFWRTYGKTIGNDIQDFLIIPLYRNEFTGEAKRYPIKRIPKRSFRHWVALMLFFCGMVSITLLQARAAVTSSYHFRLQWIPYEGFRWTALPFFWIGIVIQWCAVLTELSVVLIQFGSVLWWLGWTVGLYN